ncbi:hypothetical protein ACFL5Z_17255 [Planctomycetota bacterium]
MNNGRELQNEKLEKLFTKARLPELSPELKERVTTEATRVWKQTSVELSWKIPVRRLVASAAAAMFVVWLTNVSSDSSLARWQSDETSATSQQPPEIEVLPEMPYGPFVRYMASANRKVPAADASRLRHYVETVRRLLDEVQQNDVSKPTAPFKGRSRLYPDRSSPNSYS